MWMQRTAEVKENIPFATYLEEYINIKNVAGLYTMVNINIITSYLCYFVAWANLHNALEWAETTGVHVIAVSSCQVQCLCGRGRRLHRKRLHHYQVKLLKVHKREHKMQLKRREENNSAYSFSWIRHLSRYTIIISWIFTKPPSRRHQTKGRACCWRVQVNSHTCLFSAGRLSNSLF